MTKLFIEKIMSGGQTGVDRAALDVAMVLNIDHGGWCPKGRQAEDGIIPLKYLLKETQCVEYSQRTAFNVRDSDGTLVLLIDVPQGGTLFTITQAIAFKKPHLIVELDKLDVDIIIHWIKDYNIHQLNIAGPRESECPGIYALAYRVLTLLLSQ